MRVKQVYTPVLHLVEGLDTASAGKEAAGTVHYDAISLGILGQGLPQRRLQDVIPLGCLHRPSPQDPKILRVHQHEPAVPVWLDSFVCFGLARVAEHVVAFHVHLSMPIGYDLMHRRWAGMKKASALKMVLIGAETGLGNLVTNDDVSLLAENFQLVYGYPVHDPGGMIDSELTGFVGMR